MPLGFNTVQVATYVLALNTTETFASPLSQTGRVEESKVQYYMRALNMVLEQFLDSLVEGTRISLQH